MGGAAVSSADTGAFGSGIELNAIQRSNPEMQKRAANAIRGLVESDNNWLKSLLNVKSNCSRCFKLGKIIINKVYINKSIFISY